MLLKSRVLFITVLMAFLSRDCRATLVVVVVASDGIVIASDSKEGRTTATGIAEQPKLAHKVVILNNRIAVATIGMGWLKLRSAGLNPFDFDSRTFLNEVKNSLPPNASESLIESVIVKKLQGAMDRLSPYVSNGMLNENNAPGIPNLIEFVIVGYDHGVPLIRRIRVECNWNVRKIASPVIEMEYPLPNRPHDSRLGFFGEWGAIYRAISPDSAERKAVEERYPSARTGIGIHYGKLAVGNSAESIGVAADLIRLEAEFNSEDVGPPINFVVLSRERPPATSFLAK
jgi:hypothetical protein